VYAKGFFRRADPVRFERVERTSRAAGGSLRVSTAPVATAAAANFRRFATRPWRGPEARALALFRGVKDNPGGVKRDVEGRGVGSDGHREQALTGAEPRDGGGQREAAALRHLSAIAELDAFQSLAGGVRRRFEAIRCLNAERRVRPKNSAFRGR
jgi:hypothetical protein